MQKARVMMTVGHLEGLGAPASIVVLDATYGDVTLTAVDGATGRTGWKVDQARPAGHNLRNRTDRYGRRRANGHAHPRAV